LRRDLSSIATEDAKVKASFFVEDKSGNQLKMFDSEDPYPNGPMERCIFEDLEEQDLGVLRLALKEGVLDCVCQLEIITEEKNPEEIKPIKGNFG
jgi:hypothetical protein